MKVETHPDDVYEKRTDDRGRFYLGSDLADKEVEIAVLDVNDPDDE